MGIKYKSNEEYFDVWSPDMAYILGLIYADGNLEDASYLRGKYLRLTSTDLELILITTTNLNSKHKIVVCQPRSPNHKTKYMIRIGSHKIYDSLISLGLYPNKSKTMKMPEVPRIFLKDFIRGYFDGDGYVGTWKSNGKFRKLMTVFVSGSYIFLAKLSELIESELKIKRQKIYTSDKAYRLAYSTRDNVKLFQFMYSSPSTSFLGRKYRVFKSFFLEYNKWVSNDISDILDFRSRGEVV